MTGLHRRQLLGAGVLSAAVILGVAWLARLDFSQKISTDVLDLLPAEERAPELGLVRALASDAEARVMFFILTDAANAPASPAAARRFAAELAKKTVFDQALALDDPAPRDALGQELFEKRFTLLFPLWLQDRTKAYAATGRDPAQFTTWLANDTAAHLGQFLATPEALPFQDAVPSDPLLLLPGVLDRVKGGLALLQPSEDTSAHPPARVWARIAVSPLRDEGQGPVFAAIDEAAVATRAEFPGLQVAYTGVNRFAAASKARIQRELSWVNTLSLLAVMAVALIFIRDAYRALHLAPPVLLAVLGAWVCTTMVFPRVHILVFVIGSLLTGVAIDYGFYLYMQAPAHPDEDYWAKVRRLAKPLLSSCFTTVAGFALLFFSELPLIRQLGVFVGTGLLCALGGAVVYFSLLRNSFLQARSFATTPILPPAARRPARRILMVLWLAALPGLYFLHWKDDIRELEIPSPAVEQEDQRIRALFSGPGEETVYLTQGTNPLEARGALEKLEDWLRSVAPKAEFVNLGAIVPTADVQAAALRFFHDHPEFSIELRTALAAAGFDADSFAPFFEAYAQNAAHASTTDLDEAVRSLHAKLAGPLSLLLHVGQPPAWFVTLVSNAPADAPPADTHTVSASQLQSLNRIFGRYRESALWLSLIGLAIVGAGVFLSYGMKDGVRIFAIPCGACLGLFGVFGWLGHPLNLFNLLGAFLGVCLTHNYSIFSVTSAYRHEPPPVSVRLSALCTAASFGVLALSDIPVVRALGETVAFMVVTALLVIEFEHFAPIAKKK
jgi:predicted exporter